MSYAGLTVVQLKEKLKGKGLSTSGVKSDLVARLTEAEAEAPQEEPVAHEAAPAAPEPVEAKEEVAEASKPDAAPAATEPAAEAPEAPKPDPVDFKARAVELLEVKAKRAEKFGNQGEADSLRRTIKRIDKFGLSPENPIYKEIVGASKALSKALPDKNVKRKK